MKKLLLLLAMSCICFYSNGQSSFGIKAGVNLASMSGLEDDLDDGFDAAIHPLVAASIVGKIELSYSANLLLELGLVQRGARFTIDDSGAEGDLSLTFNQIQFSPSIAFNVSDEFSIGFGPYIGHATEFTTKGSVSYDGDTESYEEDNDFEKENEIDYGVNVSFNYLIDDSFLISAGYSKGLMDYNSEYEGADVSNNSGIMISVGYFFGN